MLSVCSQGNDPARWMTKYWPTLVRGSIRTLRQEPPKRKRPDPKAQPLRDNVRTGTSLTSNRIRLWGNVGSYWDTKLNLCLGFIRANQARRTDLRMIWRVPCPLTPLASRQAEKSPPQAQVRHKRTVIAQRFMAAGKADVVYTNVPSFSAL